MANLLDAVRIQTYLFLLANKGKGGKKPHEPEPTPRPEAAVKKALENNPFRMQLAAAKRRKASAHG
jgi:hypothetical protein